MDIFLNYTCHLIIADISFIPNSLLCNHKNYKLEETL